MEALKNNIGNIYYRWYYTIEFNERWQNLISFCGGSSVKDGFRQFVRSDLYFKLLMDFGARPDFSFSNLKYPSLNSVPLFRY